MEKTYDPQKIERHWSQVWEEQGLAKPSDHGPPYCIMLPPPNVTGTLHMGHGFQITLMDALIRLHRMMGYNTLWQGGTDHAGIATQMVVERQLSQKGQNRIALGREKFIEKVWEWREQSGSAITQQIRRIGASIDWTRERFTMDENISRATEEAFIHLYNEGLIYRGKRLVNWDPLLHTAISDLEVVTETENGSLWYIRYPLASEKGHPGNPEKGFITIATTRPETLLGDTAVAVHPDDERYQKLIGKMLKLPLTGREIPIIADEKVESTFGTGAVKVTPAHDFNDYDMGQRHQLPMINIFTLDAHLNDDVPEAYRGLERFEARKKIINDLTTQNLLEKIQPHSLNVPRGDRSGVVIEPMLTDQWFVKTSHLAKAAIEAVENDEIVFVPSTWKKTYLQWLYQIQDWCISRQLWWGHRIPIWYDDKNNLYAGSTETAVRERYQLPHDLTLHQDPDVLDTWFSASLWPFATLGWPSKTKELNTFYPTNVLVTGFDIIFFWVARMVMMGLKLTNKIPFRTVYVTGLIRDSQGKKMSKSKGNVLDPIDLIDGIDLESLIEKRCFGLLQPQMAKDIEKSTRQEFPKGIALHGTDALRFTFCALAGTGRNVNFDMGRIEGYRNFCNKLWNAARYVILNTQNSNENQDAKPDWMHQEKELSLPDLWIRTELQHLIKNVHHAFTQYRFDLLANYLYEFVWNEYCDWYLELSKCILNNEKLSEKHFRGTRHTLLEVLETLLRLMHPIMPFITEEIWHVVAPLLNISGKSIMLARYPEIDKTAINELAEQEIEWLKKITTAIRNVRSEMNVPPGKKIPVIFSKGVAQDKERLNSMQDYLKTMARLEQITWQEITPSSSENELSATAIVDQLEIHISLAGLIDKAAEANRLQKEIDKLRKEKEKSESKLNNSNYITRAPQEVVEKDRERLKQTENTLKKLEEQYQRIKISETEG